MRSDAIDRLLSSYLEIPARVSWEGALADGAMGVFDKARLEFAGVALLALPIDRLVLESERFQFVPGLPARMNVVGPRVSIAINQAQVDAWLYRARAPLAIELTPEGLEVRAEVAGLPISESAVELAIEGGWFVLKPRDATFLGVRNRFASLFRTYLPLPRLAPQTRLARIEHTSGALWLELALDDFEDEITPGLVDRIQKRFLPFPKLREAIWPRNTGGTRYRRSVK